MYTTLYGGENSTSIIKNLFNRAYKICSDWCSFNDEIFRLKQILVNNNYPLFLVDKVLKNFMKNKNPPRDRFDTGSERIPLYVRLHNVASFRSDSKTLKCIVGTHVRPVNSNSSVALVPYFKPFKISAMFSTRPKRVSSERSCVVYQFQCSEDGCNASYIGYTTNSLATRVRQHRYNPSSIKKHYEIDHQSIVPPFDVLLKYFKILHSNQNIFELKLTEAIEIQNRRPTINVKFNEMYSILKLF